VRAILSEGFAGERPRWRLAFALSVPRKSEAYILGMEHKALLGTISDDELLRRLRELTRQACRLESDLVAHIGEVDARRLYAREASPSMFAYCTQVLHLSEAQAYLRISAARAAREYPILRVMLADGRLHVSGIAKLAAHLTRENADHVLTRASHGSKRQIEELVAELAPRPDGPAVMRRLPGGGRRVEPGGSESMSTTPTERTAPALQEPPSPADEAATRSPQPPSTPAEGGATSPFPLDLDTACIGDPGTRSNRMAAHRLELRPDAVVGSAAPNVPPAEIQPLAPARYKVQFTASAELRDKLERLRALMRSSVPDGDLAAVIEAAVTLKLERLEARRFAATRAPRKEPTNAVSSGAVSLQAVSPEAVSPEAVSPEVISPEAVGLESVDPETVGREAIGLEPVSSTATIRRLSRYIPAAVRRAVWARDGSQCRYVDAQGRRCSERTRLEFHHRRPFGVGGEHGPENIALLCRAHNHYIAEHDYGRGTMEAWRFRKKSAQPEARPWLQSPATTEPEGRFPE
jgi:5-methylcytosine-specific restriction endonuclease McrA